MSFRFALALTAFAAAVAVTPARAQVEGSTPVIEAGGLSITRSDFEQMLQDDPRMAMAKVRPEAKLALGNDFGRAFALEAEARKRKLDQIASVQLKIRNYTTQLLANELLVTLRKQYMKDDALMASAYEKNKLSFAQPRVRQILVRMQGSEVALRKGKPDLTPDQARGRAERLLAQLKGGADFGTLAKAESDDLGTVPKGGDMGFLQKGSTVAEFEAEAFKLPVGSLSGVIKTAFGYHIIRVDDRKPMPLEAVRSALANELAHQTLEGIITNGYKLNMAYFGN